MTMLCTVGLAGTFKLKDEATGKFYGPFELKEGQIIVIDKVPLTITAVERVGAPAGGAEALLKDIVIPAANFREALAEDCVMFLQMELRRAHAGKPINIVVRGPKTDPFSPVAKKVTLNLQKVSAWRVLQEICAQAGYDIEAGDEVIALTPKKK